VVATDPADANAIWITEVWDTQAAHDASLQLPQVQAAITQARPFIDGFGERFVTTPVGGIGLDR
jgi:quinol monooxygenase YgiN